jgi:hypothetical protein
MTQARVAKTCRGSERIAAFQQAMQLTQRVLSFALPTDATYVPFSSKSALTRPAHSAPQYPTNAVY